MSWIDKIKSKASIKKDPANTDLWSECLGCNGNIYIADLEKIYGYVLNATTTSEQAQNSESTN